MQELVDEDFENDPLQSGARKRAICGTETVEHPGLGFETTICHLSRLDRFAVLSPPNLPTKAGGPEHYAFRSI